MRLDAATLACDAEKETRVNKKDEVYELILGRLIAARHRFGERILVKDLVAETGASRQPVMSALNRLSADGFVRIVPQVGCQVVDPEPRAIADFYLMFSELEALLARLAAERRDAGQLGALKACQAGIICDAGERGGRVQPLRRGQPPISLHSARHGALPPN